MGGHKTELWCRNGLYELENGPVIGRRELIYAIDKCNISFGGSHPYTGAPIDISTRLPFGCYESGCELVVSSWLYIDWPAIWIFVIGRSDQQSDAARFKWLGTKDGCRMWPIQIIHLMPYLGWPYTDSEFRSLDETKKITPLNGEPQQQQQKSKSSKPLISPCVCARWAFNGCLWKNMFRRSRTDQNHLPNIGVRVNETYLCSREQNATDSHKNLHRRGTLDGRALRVCVCVDYFS